MGINKDKGRSRKANPVRRLTDMARRGTACLLCFSTFIACLSGSVIQAGAEDNDIRELGTEPEICSMTIESLCDAVEDAVRNNDPMTGDEYIFTGKDAELFDFREGLFFEIYPEVAGYDDITFRTFVKLEEADLFKYNVTGDEEVIFLLINNTEKNICARVRVLDLETENIYETSFVTIPGNSGGNTDSDTISVDPEAGNEQLDYILVDVKKNNISPASLSAETDSNAKKGTNTEVIESGSDTAVNIIVDAVPESASDATDSTKKINGMWRTSLSADGSRAAAFVTTFSDLGYEGDIDQVTYTAYTDGVAVTVKLPTGALPEGAELNVTLYDEDSGEYIEALSLIEEYIVPEYDEDVYEIALLTSGDGNEDRGNSFSVNICNGCDRAGSGMITMDISFFVDGEEAEPAEPADVTIDISELLDECTEEIEAFEIWHFKEPGDPVLVAGITDADKATAGIAGFTVDSFSQFTVHWFPHLTTDNRYYGQIYVNLFDPWGNDISADVNNIDYDIDKHESMVFAKGSDFINAIGLDGYTFNHATVTDPSTDTTYGSKDNPVAYAVLTYVETSPSYTWTYTFYNKENTVLYTYTETGRQGSYEPRLNLYYSADQENFVQWSSGSGWHKCIYIYYEVLDALTGEKLPGGDKGQLNKGSYDDPLSITSKKFLGNFNIENHAYLYAAVFDPESGITYGDRNDPVTKIAADVETKDTDTAVNQWTLSIYTKSSPDEPIAAVTKEGTLNTLDPEFDPYTDLKLSIYYIEDYPGENTSFVVLNGTDGFGSDGDRSYIIGLDEYADEATGEITIKLPGNEDLGSEFTVYTAEDGTETKVLSMRADRGDTYRWKLAGWYNIVTGEYIDVSNGPASTTVYLNQDYYNVFKADWVSSTYDHGDSLEGSPVETVSTADFVTINLFDYNELFNVYSTTLGEQTGISNETWTDTGAFFESDVSSFTFLNTNNNGGTLSYPSGQKQWNTWSGSGKGMRDARLRWKITEPTLTLDTNPLLTRLFNPVYSEKTLGVTYVGSADGLFQYGTKEIEGTSEETEKFVDYFYYSSNLNAASYDQSSGEFVVYRSPQYWRPSSPITMFLPFNTYTETILQNTQVDYWFGMAMQVDFYLPGAAGQKNNDESYVNMVNGNEMTFNFSGDDDILIFVDNDLILDMSGIHDEADGSINFATGEWQCYTATDTSYDHENTKKSGSLLDSGVKSGTHTLTVYYMERGAGASNLTVSFNIVPQWRYYSDEVSTVTVEKIWSDREVVSHEEDSVTMGLFEEIFDEEYIYSNDNGNRIYTVDGNEYVFKGDSDYAYDSEEKINAFLKDETLFILVDKTPIGIKGTQELSSDNSWEFAWELLDISREYRVLEIDGPEGYTVSSNNDSFDTWQYWSIIGETEIEALNGDGVEHWIILTDAADDNENGKGYYKGNVVTNDLDLVQIVFSEAPQWVANTTGDTYAEFGEAADSEIDELDEAVKFRIIFTGEEADDDEYADSQRVHTFYLVTENDTYLKLSSAGNSLEHTSDKAGAAKFYVDSYGELCIDESGERVVIQYNEVNGEHEVKVVERSDNVAEDGHINVRVYSLSEVETYGTSYEFLNTPQLILKKVDSVTESFIPGAEFTLQNSAGEYYSFNDDSGKVEWSPGPAVIKVESEDGLILMLEDGSYTLTEVKSPDGYLILSEPISFEVQNSVFVVSQENEYWEISGNNTVLIIKNSSGAVLPDAGGEGTAAFRFTGLLMMIGSALLYLTARRRKKKDAAV